MHKCIDERSDSLKDDTYNELDSMAGRLNSLGDVIQSERSNSRSMNFIFRKGHVPEVENIVDKINMFIKDHMEVEDVKVWSGKRKLNTNTGSRTSGVVIATFGRETKVLRF